MKILCERVRTEAEATRCDHCGDLVNVGRDLYVVLATGGAYCCRRCAAEGEAAIVTRVEHYGPLPVARPALVGG